MPSNRSLQISSRVSGARPTLEQERFDYLITQLEKMRKSHADLETTLLKFHQTHSEKLRPLRTSLARILRETVHAIDRALEQRGWSAADRVALRNILCGTAEMLLETDGDDEEIKALFDKHSTIDFDAIKQEEFQRLKAQAEEMTGLDLGEDQGIRTEEDLMQRMYEEMSRREAAEEARRSEKKERRKSAAQKRTEDSALLARQSLREIYRKLASAVHPDRESDPERRERKNELMQKINQAYAANDLMSLFETQMQIEQIDAGHIARLGAQKLKQYNKLLAEQLARLTASIARMEAAFCADHGLEPGSASSPRRLNLRIQRQARELRAEISQQQQFLEVLSNKAATKRWLKHQRTIFDDIGESL